MAKKPAAAPVAAPTSSRKGVSKGNKRPRNPARAERDLRKAELAKVSGETKRLFAAANPDKLPTSKADCHSNRKARRAKWRSENPDIVDKRAEEKRLQERKAAKAVEAFDKGVAKRIAGHTDASVSKPGPGPKPKPTKKPVLSATAPIAAISTDVAPAV